VNREPLLAVVRLRRMALDDASREFAESLRREAEAQQAAAAVEAAIVREADAATSLAADDATVEAFGIWLKRARQDLRVAQAARDDAEIETTRVRAVLQAARAAVKAAEQMLAEKQAAQQATLARRQQAELDETGQHPRR
jgi:hypothetical protein